MSKEQRITKTTHYLMIGTAIFYDTLQVFFGLVQFIPVVGNVLGIAFDYAINIIALLTFFVWFAMRRASFFKGRRMAVRVTAMAAELLPFVPGWTIAVWVGSTMVQSEDREKDAEVVPRLARRKLKRLSKVLTKS